MRILGVDPGLSRAGIGLIEKDQKGQMKAIDWLTIETSPSLPLDERLLELGTDLRAYIADAKPDLAVVEALFFAANKKTAMDIAHARGVIILLLKEAHIPILSPTPLQLKSTITGDGAADKKQVQAMVKRILKLDEDISPADAADALGLALYGGYSKVY